MTTAAMSAVSGQADRPILNDPGYRVRRALFVSGNIGLMLGALLGLLRVQPNLLTVWFPFQVPSSAIPLVGMTVIGLFVGATAGLALRGTNGWLRFGTALFVMMASLLTSEIFRSVGLRLPFKEVLTGEVPAVMAGQIGLGMLGSLIGMQTGRVRIRPTGTPQGRSTNGRQRSSGRRGTRGRSRGLRPSTPASSSPSQGVQIISPAPVKKPMLKKRRLFRRGVHLGREKTSMCPYCLEEVKPRDSRGRVVCKICGTPHHADCWAITGKCEVPHLQT